MNNVIEPDISLVAALWQFIEDRGGAEEYRELRERVRCHGHLYDSAPALLSALEGLLPHVEGARESDTAGRPWLERAISVTASVRGLS
ncbi:hypothetical protein JOH52_000819 [Sinorhizobium meliloti]|uniref:hypothetical protein n=1 Tax=Rhizobium meliloti TaxID=382 RepID=UPI000D12B0CF|nr:hypothetical protein [Sinorhizobium meliloti]MBP2464798.1 hypothetical protein [Sinorhizobium meliloti]MQW83419.1 hypothetical protein [Sinorhizobium meliloti]PST29513.1 hypothetical protein C7U62_02685 [Mesorhizobium loti]GEC36478.1 hypothetical protein EME01_05500 [Sinorhizobium meliloti]